MKSRILYISLLFATTLLNMGAAQDFLITPAGDTLRGEIKPIIYGAEKKVQLTEPGKKKTIYQFFQLKYFSYKGEIFQPVKGAKGYTFMKLIKPGYLSLLNFQHENQVVYDGIYLLKKDGTGTELPNLSFKKVMKRFLGDCPDVADKIENDELNRKDLNKIIDDYNACVNSRSVNHEKEVSQKTEQIKKISAWDVLEQKVKSQPDFEEKNNALEMISEIKSKISSFQKIPNFLLEGLKSSLDQDEFKVELENALNEVN